MIKNVLILGGSGFIGTWIANRLSAKGIRVTVPTRRRDRTKALITLPTAEMVEANIHDVAALTALMRGQDAVINLVGILHDHDSQLPYGKGFAAAHVELPQKIISAMKAAGVRRLLHMSALNADPQGVSEYLRSKGVGERIVQDAASELDVTIFRPSVVFGSGDSFLSVFASFLAKLPFFPVGCVNARFQPVYVGNVADAFVAAISDIATYGQTYTLVGPEVYTLRELIEYTGQVSGHPTPVVALPDGLAYLQAGLLWLLPNPPMSPDNLRSMDIDNVDDGGQRFPGWAPAALESVAPAYLGRVLPKTKLDGFRYHAGR